MTYSDCSWSDGVSVLSCYDTDISRLLSCCLFKIQYTDTTSDFSEGTASEWDNKHKSSAPAWSIWPSL